MSHGKAGILRLGTVAAAVAILLLCGSALAVDVITEGDMEIPGTDNWLPGIDILATNTHSETATDQMGGGTYSLKGTSQIGRRLPVGWYYQQTIGTVDQNDTVALSLWYGFNFTVNIGQANGTLYFDIRPASGVWTNVWSQVLSLPAPNTFVSGTISDLDVSGSFTTTESYDIRLRFEGQTGNAVAAAVMIWWDNIVLDVTSGNTPPTVAITAPADASSYNQGDAVDFTGTASDTEDGDLTASLSWSSSIDGVIGVGGSFSRSDLSVGTHTITASVTDSGGLTGQDQITITINGPPTVAITAPADASNHNQGDAVDFTGTASDTEDGDLTASLSWSSSIDGVIGVGGSFSRSDLSVGTHTITASVTDSGGLTGQDQITITINAIVNETTPDAPTANIDNCNQITVTVTFAGDANNNGATVFERSPNGVDSWAQVPTCGAVGGASPRTCVDSSVADSSVNYYRTDFSDPDGVLGTDPSNPIGPYDTSPYCGVDGTTIDANSAGATTCNLVTTTSRFTGDSNGDGTTEVQYNTVNSFPGTIACAGSGGPSPRQCLIPGLIAGQDYWVRFHYVDPDGVSAGAAPQDEVIGPVNTGACAGDGVAPMILPLSPSRNAIIGGVDTVKVHVFDNPIGSVSVVWSLDGGATSPATENINYDCGTDCAVFEFALNTTTVGINPLSLSNGSHYLTIEATDSDGHVTTIGHAIRVNNAGDQAAGSGMLLRRTRGSQLCIDCHNLPTHSSQQTSSKYGNWAIGCTVCHTPHRTTNIYLIDGAVQTPSSGSRAVRFETTAGAVADSSVPGTASYVNEDNAAQADGVCQACHTRTENSSGNARWRNADSGGNADTHYSSGATSRCTDCHTHDAGFSGAGAGCDSCHFAPPTVGKHGSHDEVSEVPTNYTNTTATATATQYGFACVKCHSGSHFNAGNLGTPADPYVVEIVFDDTADPANPDPPASYTSAASQNDTGANGETWSWSDGTCGGLYCHSNANPLGGVNSYQTVTWDQAASLNCTSCHDTAGAGSGLSSAHRLHTDSVKYDYECLRCHIGTVTVVSNDAIADKREHVDGGKDVLFDSGGVDNSGGSYAGGPGYACSDTYCHSDGTDQTAPYSSGPSIAWNTTATCRSCHGGDAGGAPAMSTGKHENHVNNAGVIGDNYECGNCHSGTVSAGDNEVITGFGNHVNGASDVSGALVDATYSGPTCTASYCHSSGQDSGASFEYYATPDWFTGTVDALNCLGCHGRHSTASVPSGFGEPDYPNGGAGDVDANSHDRHISAAADCTNCHNTTTATGTSILASAPHTDQNRDVVIAASWDTNGGTSNYLAGTKTCNSIACHGAGTPQWGAALVCLDCHTGTEGGNLGDGFPNAVDDEWNTDGHGSAAGGSMTSALDGCDYCHQLDSAHTPAAGINPYRLRIGTQDTGGNPAYDFGVTPGNRLCLACHETGDSGISRNSDGSVLAAEDSALDVDTAHFGAKHQQPEGGELCWDCHDPHGVPANILMVKSQVSRASDQYGVPAATVAVTFTDNTTPGQAVGRFTEDTNTPRQGICQACHDPDSGNGDETTTDGPSKYWRSDGTDDPDNTGGSASTHNASVLCTDCHEHTNNFAGAGGDCLGCHGDASGAAARRAVRNDFGLNSHHVGASVDADGNALFAQPNMGGALTNFDCVVCHAEGNVVAGETDTTGQPHMDGVIDLRNTDNGTAYWSYDKDGITGASNTWMSGNSTWETRTSTALDPFCLSCHDVDGAAATFNSGVDEGLAYSGSATNPFADSAITNEYDQRDRTAVVNIRNKVDAYVDNSNNTITPVDREGGGEPRTADGRPDPTDGIYSRHAIRGDGTFGSGSVYGTSQIPANRWETRPSGGSWNDTSLMGCADCHTTDGANDASGNAHGAGTEYLLKNKDGSSATEPDFDVKNADVSEINCYKCHSWVWYARETGSQHSDNNSDFVFRADQDFPQRVASNGNVYGLPCTNCHGGFGWGSIHGTSDMFNIDAGPAQRQAYRFMNGASLRYFDPNGWNATTYTCYTLSSPDSFGACTQHVPGNGKTFDRPLVRDIQY